MGGSILKSISSDSVKSEILDDAMRPSRRAVLHQVGSIFLSGLNFTTASVKGGLKAMQTTFDEILPDKRNKSKLNNVVSIVEIDHKGRSDKYRDIPANASIGIGCYDELFIKLSYIYSLIENKYEQVMPVDICPVVYAEARDDTKGLKRRHKVLHNMCSVEVNSRIGRLDSETKKSVYDSILTFSIDLTKLPRDIEKFNVGLLIVFANTRLQDFSRVENLKVEVLNETSRKSYIGIDVGNFKDSENVERIKQLSLVTSGYMLSDKVKGLTGLNLLSFEKAKAGWVMKHKVTRVPFDVEKDFTEFHANLVLSCLKDYLG